MREEVSRELFAVVGEKGRSVKGIPLGRSRCTFACAQEIRLMALLTAGHWGGFSTEDSRRILRKKIHLPSRPSRRHSPTSPTLEHRLHHPLHSR